MSYEVSVDDFTFHTFKNLWQAKLKEKLYKQVFPHSSVKIRSREHASQ